MVQKIEYNYNEIWHGIKANKIHICKSQLYSFLKLHFFLHFLTLLKNFQGTSIIQQTFSEKLDKLVSNKHHHIHDQSRNQYLSQQKGAIFKIFTELEACIQNLGFFTGLDRVMGSQGMFLIMHLNSSNFIALNFYHLCHTCISILAMYVTHAYASPIVVLVYF